MQPPIKNTTICRRFAIFIVPTLIYASDKYLTGQIHTTMFAHTFMKSLSAIFGIVIPKFGFVCVMSNVRRVRRIHIEITECRGFEI
ncbi:MAG: hypothetical protein VYE62_07815 [Pseudomonadota bacterium]|nr:hypothetical protein [Pseudomonadota bacterium]